MSQTSNRAPCLNPQHCAWEAALHSFPITTESTFEISLEIIFIVSLFISYCVPVSLSPHYQPRKPCIVVRVNNTLIIFVILSDL